MDETRKQDQQQPDTTPAQAPKLRLNKETVHDLESPATGDVKGGYGKTDKCYTGSLAP